MSIYITVFFKIKDLIDVKNVITEVFFHNDVKLWINALKYRVEVSRVLFDFRFWSVLGRIMHSEFNS